MHSVGSPALWVGFTVFVLVMLLLDLSVFHRRSHAVSFREALGFSALWVMLAVLFGLGIYWRFGAPSALEFAAGYLIEKSLSVDNLFVFLLIFTAFRVPSEQQHRVLFWGVLGALVMRGLFIAAGAALLRHFHWILYVFGVVLLWSALKMWRDDPIAADPKRSAAYRLFCRLFPYSPEFSGQSFWVRLDGRSVATPLFAALVVVELTDVIFAVDSIPAIFAVTSDPFIIYTSNIFAILGLRSLYFLLSGALHRFYLLRPALSAVLGLVGAKLLVSDWYEVPILVSLAVIASLLVSAIVASVVWPRQDPPVEPPRRPEGGGPQSLGPRAPAAG
jgi:tellurite resistance protein TerC